MSTHTLWVVDKKIPDAILFVDSSSDKVRTRFEEVLFCRDVSANPLRFECSACGGVSNEIAPIYCPCCGSKVEHG